MAASNEVTYPSWEEMLDMKSGTTLRDWFEEDIRCIIKRSNASICAYIGVKSGHPLANHNYDDIPLSVHGGLTYAGEGDDAFFPNGYYWYGWDYAHLGDYVFYYDDIAGTISSHKDDKKWLGKEVEQEVQSAVYDFKKLMDIAEKTGNYIHLD